jgi:hypothetical protein
MFRKKAYVGESGICIREYLSNHLRVMVYTKSLRSTYIVYIIQYHIKYVKK